MSDATNAGMADFAIFLVLDLVLSAGGLLGKWIASVLWLRKRRAFVFWAAAQMTLLWVILYDRTGGCVVLACTLGSMCLCCGCCWFGTSLCTLGTCVGRCSLASA